MNLAVILSLAGMDYSHVIEPLWREDLVHTARESMSYIRDLSENTLRLYERAQEAPHRYKKEGRYWVRERSVYYDTDGIHENQREEVLDCLDCAGLQAIRTRTDHLPWSWCLYLPRNACPACRTEAEARRRQITGKGESLEYSDWDQDLYERL